VKFRTRAEIVKGTGTVTWGPENTLGIKRCPKIQKVLKGK